MVKYTTAEAWRDEAMQRANGVDEAESERRREMVRQHQLREGVQADTDMLSDYELYILGKMDIEEYEKYLLFKHGRQN